VEYLKTLQLVYEKLAEQDEELRQRLKLAEENKSAYESEELKKYKNKYYNLLAVAHRDGGQYLEKYGEEKAEKDAISNIMNAYFQYFDAIEVEGIIEKNQEILHVDSLIEEFGEGTHVKVLIIPVGRAA